MKIHITELPIRLRRSDSFLDYIVTLALRQTRSD